MGDLQDASEFMKCKAVMKDVSKIIISTFRWIQDYMVDQALISDSIQLFNQYENLEMQGVYNKP